MHPTFTHADDRERRLDEAVAAWLNAASGGTPPDPQTWLARYPDLADELSQFFADQERLDQLAKPLRQAIQPATPPVQRDPDAETLTETGAAPPTAATVAGSRFGDYELLAEIARGGMGVVYKARQTRLNRTVAVKMILAGELADQDDVRRFLVEAEAAAGLDHPGIVPVYECGQIGGRHFFSMGFVDGQSLSSLLAAGPLPPRRAAELLIQVAEAVAYAHEQGVIHRDLKPGNILLDQDGHPRVTDFGLAKKVTGDSGLTHTGQALGTPSYMPPEQAAGRLGDVGAVSDVYACGAVLYAMLTGRPPFQAANPLDTLLQVLEQEPVAPRQLNADVPRDLETIALRCLEKEPRKRYQTASELADELRRYLRGEPILARPVGRPERAWRWCRRNPLVAGLAASVLIALMSGAGVSTYFAVEAQQRADDAEASATAARQAEGREKQQRVTAQAATRAEQKQKLAAQAAQAREKDERLRAERQLRLATALRLAAQAKESLPDFPQRAALLATAAIEATQTAGEPRVATAEQSLRDALGLISGSPLAGPPGPSVGMTIDPVSGELLTVGADRVVRSWDMQTCQPGPRSWELPKLPGDPYQTPIAVFSPDARWLATFDRIAELHELLRDAPPGQPKAKSWTLPNMFGGVPFFQFTPDNRFLLGANIRSGVNLWRLSAEDPAASGIVIGAMIFPAGSVATSPDGRWLAISATAGLQQNAQLFDLNADNPGTTARLLHKQKLAAGHQFAFSAKGHWLAVGYDMVPGVGGGAAAAAAAAAAAGNAPTFQRPGVLIWDLNQPADAAPRELTSALSPATTLVFSSDERWLAAGTMLGAELYDLGDAGATTAAHRLQGVSSTGLPYLAFSRGDHWLATADAGGHVRLWDLTAADPAVQPRALAENTSGVRCLKTMADGRWLISVGGDNAIRLWDLAAADPATAGKTLRGQEQVAADVYLSPNGRWLSAGAATPRIWDLLAPDAKAEPFFARVASKGDAGAQFSDDGRWLLTRTQKGINLWDLTADWPFAEPNLVARPDGVTAFAITSDGRRLAAGNWVGNFIPRYWDLSSGRPVAEPTDAPTEGFSATRAQIDQSVSPESWRKRPAGLAFSSDGRWLVGAMMDKQVQLFDTRSDRPASEPVLLTGHELARSADNHWLATADSEGAGHLWDLTQSPPAQSRFPFGKQPWVKRSLLSASGRHLVGFGMGNTAHLWRTQDAGDGQHIHLGSCGDDPKDALFLAGGRWLAFVPHKASDYRCVRLCDLESPDPTGVFVDLPGHTGHIQAIAADAQGRRLVSSADDGTLRVWDLSQAPAKVTSLVLQPHDAPDHRLAMSPDGRWVAVGGAKQFVVQLWDLDAPDDFTTPVLLPGPTSRISRICFSPDNHWLMAASVAGQEVRVWRVGVSGLATLATAAVGRKLRDDERERYRLDHRPPRGAETVRRGVGRKSGAFEIRHYLAPVTSVAYTPDGRFLASGGWNGTVKFCDRDGGEPRWQSYHRGQVWSIAVSRDSRWFASAGGDGKVVIGQVADGAAVHELAAHEGGAHDVAFDPTGARLATAGADGGIKFWQTTTGKLLHAIHAHERPVWGLAFDAAGKRLASAGHDKLVKIWDVASRNELLRCEGHTDVAWGVAFSPDGRWLASTSDDRSVRVWDAATGQEVHNFMDHSISPYRVVFSLDGEQLCSAAAHRWQPQHEGELLVWDTDTWQLFAKRRGSKAGFLCLAASPDGHDLAGAGTDGVVRIWPIAERTLLAAPASP